MLRQLSLAVANCWLRPSLQSNVPTDPSVRSREGTALVVLKRVQQGGQPTLPEVKENSSSRRRTSKCVSTREGISQPDIEILQECKNLRNTLPQHGQMYQER